ncbi:MAG TPA: ATP-binding protein [Spirochaetota bacterium]|nr:ATP-binding protein [Spirochaetota bacterium]
MAQPRILIVDDDELAGMSLRGHIKRMGYHECGMAANSGDALDLITRTAPDLVLMDIMIEGELDGVETAKLILQRFDVPIVYLTASADTETVERAKATSPFGYLIKPIEENALRVTIEMALYKHAVENRIKRSQRHLEEINAAFLAFSDEPMDNITVVCELVSSILRSSCTMFLQLKTDGMSRPVCSTRTDGAQCRHICEKRADWIENLLSCVGDGITILPAGELGPPWKRVIVFPLKRIRRAPTVILTLQQHDDEISDEDMRLAGILVNAAKAQEDRIETLEARARMHQQLAQTQRLESIGTMAGGVAHEINNPLMGIINLAQLVYDRSEGLPGTQAWASEIISEGQRIARIVRSLLAFSQQDGSGQALVDIKEIIDDVITLVRRQLEKDEIVLELEIAAHIPVFPCRRQQIEQVILNLVNNARDALLARFQTWNGEKIIKIRCLYEGQQIVLEVEDHGIGIPPEMHERIFDPFFTTKPRHKASGLGLSVSYGIIKEHGGDLSFESVPGEKTVFRVTLPGRNETG